MQILKFRLPADDAVIALGIAINNLHPLTFDELKNAIVVDEDDKQLSGLMALSISVAQLVEILTKLNIEMKGEY